MSQFGGILGEELQLLINNTLVCPALFQLFAYISEGPASGKGKLQLNGEGLMFDCIS